MELLSKYQSSGSGSSEGEDQSARLSANELEVQQQITRRTNRQVYLLTLSQVPTLLVPTRQDFADAVISAYQSFNADVVHWCVSKESHEHRGKESGYHYHMALKCDRPHRRLPIATHLRASRDLRVARSAHKNIDIKNKEIGELKIFKTKDPSCKANNINTVQCQEYCQHRPPSVNNATLSIFASSGRRELAKAYRSNVELFPHL